MTEIQLSKTFISIMGGMFIGFLWFIGYIFLDIKLNNWLDERRFGDDD